MPASISYPVFGTEVLQPDVELNDWERDEHSSIPYFKKEYSNKTKKQLNTTQNNINKLMLRLYGGITILYILLIISAEVRCIQFW